MQNMIKPATAPVISELTEANIGAVMVTGKLFLFFLVIFFFCIDFD